jgi:hypothetical protein
MGGDRYSLEGVNAEFRRLVSGAVLSERGS